jgi:rod shape-determining protein MreC
VRLSSKIKFKYLAGAILVIILLAFPLKNFLGNILVFFSRQLIFSEKALSHKGDIFTKKNLILTLKLRELIYLKKENDKLRAALDFKRQTNLNLIGAEIIAFDPSSYRRLAILNVGYNQGIAKGAYVIDEQGYLVGKIADVKANYSYLMLIDDSDFSSPVFIGNSALGMLKGTLNGVDIFYIEESDNIKIKDKVWLKVASISFPIYIGEVKRIRKDTNSLFLAVEISLYSREPILHKLFVIK